MEIKGLMPGTKVDIRILQQVRNETAEIEKTAYISSVYDVEEDDAILVYMPIWGGKIQMLPMDLRYEFVFTVKNGLYKAVGRLQDRMKRDNFYLFRVRLISPLEKFQRREYYRLECIIPLLYDVVTPEMAALPNMDEIRSALMENPDNQEIVGGVGTILDISGGGMRFATTSSLENAQYLLLQFSLEDEGRMLDMELLGERVSSEAKPEADQFIHRIKFHFRNRRDQETIIHFIFQIQRKLRKKEQG